jgi:hypothetical protein
MYKSCQYESTHWNSKPQHFAGDPRVGKFIVGSDFFGDA